MLVLCRMQLTAGVAGNRGVRLRTSARGRRRRGATATERVDGPGHAVYAAYARWPD